MEQEYYTLDEVKALIEVVLFTRLARERRAQKAKRARTVAGFPRQRRHRGVTSRARIAVYLSRFRDDDDDE